MKKFTLLSLLILSFTFLSIGNLKAADNDLLIASSTLDFTGSTANSDGTFTYDDCVFVLSGAKWNASSTPTNYGKGGYADSYANFIRFGSNGNYMTITPDEEFVSGGKVVVTWGSNTKNPVVNISCGGVTDAFSEATANTIYTNTFTLPETVEGNQAIRIERPASDGVTFFIFKIEVYSNSGTGIPSPKITAPANKNQQVLANTAINNIEYTYTNATALAVTFEPTSYASEFIVTPDEGKVTISGTPVTAGTVTYTVTATGLEGYEGEPVTATGTIQVLDASKKSIAYVTTSDDFISFNDAIYTHLSQYYNITLLKPTAAMDFSAYDMVIGDERLSWDTENNYLKTAFDKPFLNMKSFFYTSVRWAWGAADNGAKNNGIVTVLEPNHPIYDGITISSCTLDVMGGTLPEKTLQGVTLSSDYTGFAHNLAQVANTDNDGNVVSFHEIATGGTLGEIAVTNKYIMLAISQTATGNLNEAGLAIVKNACDYLMSSEVFGDENCTKKYAKQEITGFAVNDKTISWNAIPATEKYEVTLTSVTRSGTMEETTTNSYNVSEAGEYTATIVAKNAAGTASQTLITSTFNVTAGTGVEDSIADKAIASVKYYSITGVEVDENATGVVIVKTTYEDGSVSTAKSVKK